jgi:hypothetical protein
VIRRHYEKMDQQAIVRKNVERRLGLAGTGVIQMHQSLRAGCARALDDKTSESQTASA